MALDAGGAVAGGRVEAITEGWYIVAYIIADELAVAAFYLNKNAISIHQLQVSPEYAVFAVSRESVEFVASLTHWEAWSEFKVVSRWAGSLIEACSIGEGVSLSTA